MSLETPSTRRSTRRSVRRSFRSSARGALPTTVRPNALPKPGDAPKCLSPCAAQRCRLPLGPRLSIEDRPSCIWTWRRHSSNRAIRWNCAGNAGARNAPSVHSSALSPASPPSCAPTIECRRSHRSNHSKVARNGGCDRLEYRCRLGLTIPNTRPGPT
jgi:hypothetical protein